MAFVNEDEVAVAEGVHLNAHTRSLPSALFDQLGDLGHPHRAMIVREQPGFAEARRWDTGRGHLCHVLGTQSFVGRDEDDVVQMLGTPVVQELQVVEVHDQRLAASGRHPERELVQVLRCDESDGMSGHKADLALHIPVDLLRKRFRRGSPPVEEELGIKRGELLEVA